MTEQTYAGFCDRVARMKVLLADDNQAIRQAIRHVLEREPTIQVLGEASSFTQAFQMCSDLKPDVVILDLHMPGEEDFQPEVIRARLLDCAERVLAISIYCDNEARALATSYGAAACLDKMSLSSELIPALMGFPG